MIETNPDQKLTGYSKSVQLIDSFYGDNETGTDLDTEAGDEEAVTYALKNLSDDATFERVTNGDKVVAYTIKDKWAVVRDTQITLTPSLYKVGETFYYVVHLQENVAHLFLGGFRGMDAPVVAIAKLTKTADTDPETPKPEEVVPEEVVEKIETAKNTNVIIGNWEVQDIYRKSGNKAEFKNRFGYEIYDGKWNMYTDSKNHYKKGDNRRTETINITPAKNGNSFSSTSANGNKYYDETQVDSLDIDFNWEVQFNKGSKWLAEDWDLELGYDSSVAKVSNNTWDTSGKYKSNDIRTMRIHSMINFDEPYEARPNAEDDPDILWVRIESETMLHYPDSPNGEASKKNEDMRNFNSVHQIIINFNSDNTEKSTDGKDIYRPVIIFYDGPETNDSYYDSYRTNENVLHRKSLPVIVNLNADFQGVLYMPNSSVVLNDNGYKFKGFIVAKNYLKLKTEDDFYSEDGKYYNNAGKTTEYFKISETKNGKTNTMFIDEKGNVQYGNADPRKKYGTYDTFGRTDFTTHNYTLSQTSAYNLLLSNQ